MTVMRTLLVRMTRRNINARSITQPKAGPQPCRSNPTGEIHDFVEKVGWRAVGTKGLPHRTQWVFVKLNGKTRLTYILEYSLPIPVLGVLLDRMLMRPGWQRRLEASLGNLKRRFEGG